MRKLLVVAITALVALGVIAGCGTAATSTGTSQSASPSPKASPTPPTEAQVLTSYLKQCKKVRAAYNKVMNRCEKLKSKALDREARKLYGIETRWALINPPKGLAAAHKAYGLSIRYNKRSYQEWTYGNYSSSNRYSDKASEQFDTYHLALTVVAKRLHVKIPWKWDLG
jgi:hypothetical protein